MLSTVLIAWARSARDWLLPISCALLLVGLVNWLWAKRLEKLRNVRFKEQLAERTRTARDLQDTLLQTIEASKMIADDALDPPADLVRMRRTMNRISDWLGQATMEGQAALDSLRTAALEESGQPASSSPLSPRKVWRRHRRRRRSNRERP